MKRILVADEHQVTLKGIEVVLKNVFSEVEINEAISFKDLLNQKQTKDWDLIILEAVMSSGDLIQALREIRSVNRKVPILVFSSSHRIEHAAFSMREGANGFIKKNSHIHELVKAVTDVMTGKHCLSVQLAADIESYLKINAGPPLHQKLSARELEIFMLIAKGHSIKEIAQLLAVSEKTVATHLTRSREKTGLISPVQIATYAFRNGLIN